MNKLTAALLLFATLSSGQRIDQLADEMAHRAIAQMEANAVDPTTFTLLRVIALSRPPRKKERYWLRMH